MIVAPKYHGDEDHAIMSLQHDVYLEAIGLILDVTREHFLRATRLLRTSTRFVTEFVTIKSCDHRTLQDVHDLLAAAWRYSKSTSQQLDLFDDPDISVRSWLGWLDRELQQWVDEPMLLIELASIVTHQNSAAGYAAESRLFIALFERHYQVPWKDEVERLVERLRAGLVLHPARQQAEDASAALSVKNHGESQASIEESETSGFGCVCHRKGRKPCNQIPCVTHVDEAERAGTGPLE